MGNVKEWWETMFGMIENIKNVGIWCEEGWEMTSGTMWNIKEFSHCREPSRYREKWSPKTL